MEGIIHIRIDDRLIHGQVATQWTNELGATRIMVINDEISQNEMQKTLLRVAAPPNVSTSIISRETAYKNITNGKYKGQRVLVVVKSPVDILALVNMGLDIKNVNVGNMSTRPETTRLKATVCVTEEEKNAFEELINRGLEITAIMVPGEPRVYIKDCM